MIETGAPVKRSALIAAVMKHFEINYALFMENGDLSGLQESYNEMLVNRGKEYGFWSREMNIMPMHMESTRQEN